MKNLKLIFALTVATLLASCVNSDDYGTPDLSGDCLDLVANVPVTVITNAAVADTTRYTTDDIMEAYITSSDEGGNFYKSISMVSTDGVHAFSMPVDAYNTYSQYEPGRKVFINLKDLYFNSYQSAPILGSSYEDRVGRLSGVTYQNIIIRSCEKVNEDEITNFVSINEALNDNYLNKLIEFDNVQFTTESFGKTYFDESLNNYGGATNHMITDNTGAQIIFRVSEYANFAGDEVSTGSGKIRGVLTKYNSDYQFLARTKVDIKLDAAYQEIDFNPPLVGGSIAYNGSLTEPFSTYANYDEEFPMYINDAVVGDRYWAVRSFGGNSYIQMSSFGGGNTEANVCAFMVPVDFSAANTLSFKTKDGYNNGNVLKVYYTTDYVVGGNINDATLTDITANFTIASGSTSGYAANFTNSGNYAIPAAVTGNGFFVFEYSGHGSDNPTTTMQIDDITIN